MKFFDLRESEMLVLVLPDGRRIDITAVWIQSGRPTRIGIKADVAIPIVREELLATWTGHHTANRRVAR